MLVVDFYKIPIGISLGVVAGILILSMAVSVLVRWKEEGVLLSRLGLEKFSAQNPRHRPDRIAYARVGVLILFVAVVLGVAKWDSVVTGPSGDDAIAAIRVVQRELVEAQWVHGTHAPKLYGANAILDEAWSKLEEKRYAEAISAAQKAKVLLRTLPR
jgi:hypothetical protein